MKLSKKLLAVLLSVAFVMTMAPIAFAAPADMTFDTAEKLAAAKALVKDAAVLKVDTTEDAKASALSEALVTALVAGDLAFTADPAPAKLTVTIKLADLAKEMKVALATKIDGDAAAFTIVLKADGDNWVVNAEETAKLAIAVETAPAYDKVSALFDKWVKVVCAEEDCEDQDIALLASTYNTFDFTPVYDPDAAGGKLVSWDVTGALKTDKAGTEEYIASSFLKGLWNKYTFLFNHNHQLAKEQEAEKFEFEFNLAKPVAPATAWTLTGVAAEDLPLATINVEKKTENWTAEAIIGGILAAVGTIASAIGAGALAGILGSLVYNLLKGLITKIIDWIKGLKKDPTTEATTVTEAPATEAPATEAPAGDNTSPKTGIETQVVAYAIAMMSALFGLYMLLKKKRTAAQNG